MPTSKALRTWLASLDGARQIVVDDAYGWNEPSRRAETLVRAAPAATAAALAERLGEPEEGWGWARSWLVAGKAAGDTVNAQLARLDEPTEPGLHAALGRLYANGDLVYTASSMPIRDQEAFLAPQEADVRFLANRGANGIDGLVSSGIGAAVESGRPTWIVTGDLGLHHDMNGLAALRSADAPVRIVVLNNGGGGIFEFLPQSGQIERGEFEALFGTPVGLDLARVAALFDIPHSRIERLDDLHHAIRAGTALIEVPVDRRRNVQLHRRLAELAAAAIGRALVSQG
jgi:2-succinyl-5-enolpyruvyl-6-hydroxy-3-cyclohexene-1-carboxylate synthase